MNLDKTGGTAFPVVDDNYKNFGKKGMALRQYYAAKAMQAFIATPDSLRGADLPESSFMVADAMIKFEQDEQK